MRIKVLLCRRDGEFLALAANFGFPPEFETFLRDHPQKITRGTVGGRAILEGQAVHIVDVAADPEYALPEAVAIGRSRSGIGVPLLREGEPIGSISLARRRVEPFTERQIELVRIFADQAVIAIENTRLLTELREALEQQTATAEVLQVINSSPGELAPVFNAMLEKAMRLCDASMGVFTNFDGNRFKPAVSRGVPPRYAEYLATTSDQPSPDGTNQRVLGGENVAHVIDLTEAVGYRSGHPWVRALVEFGEGTKPSHRRSKKRRRLAREDHPLPPGSSFLLR
jgi:two-component system, NtrC family, sensor kinase